MFNHLFTLVGPVWSAVALLALVLAYVAVVASETARVARQGEPALAWRAKLSSLTASLRRKPKAKPKTLRPLGSSPSN